MRYWHQVNYLIDVYMILHNILREITICDFTVRILMEKVKEKQEMIPVIIKELDIGSLIYTIRDKQMRS